MLFGFKPVWSVLFVGSLSPLLYLCWLTANNGLGVEPAKYVVEFLAETALVFLLLTLSVSPLAKVRVIKGVLRYRRMIGLYALFYAVLHVLSYGLFLVDWQNFLEDLYKRAYISVGLVAFVILCALGATSPRVMVKRLGKRWKVLHRYVYLAAMLVIVHYWWQVRSDYTAPLIYGLVLLVLLSFRWRVFYRWFRPNK